MVITIDGISWLGKSYIGKKLAEALEIDFFSTGLLVRLVAYKFVLCKSNYNDEYSAVKYAVETVNNNEIENILNYDLYNTSVENALKIIAKYNFVAPSLNSILRIYVRNKTIILDGRFTFSLFPDANKKYYFRSTIENRVELYRKVKNVSIEEAIQYINFRDSFEENIVLPKDVIVIDPFNFSTEEIIEFLREDILNEGL